MGELGVGEGLEVIQVAREEAWTSCEGGCWDQWEETGVSLHGCYL